MKSNIIVALLILVSVLGLSPEDLRFVDQLCASISGPLDHLCTRNHTTACEWQPFLECDKNSNINKLQIYGSSIPSFVGRLTNLHHLAWAGIDQNIPSEIGKLVSLTILDLRCGAKQFQMPTQLGCLTRLKQLILTGFQTIPDQ